MANASAPSRRTRGFSGAIAVLLIFTIPVGLYAFQWTLALIAGDLDLNGERAASLAIALVYVALGTNAIYRAWTNRPGSVPIVLMMWAMAVAACLMSYFWHLSFRLTPSKLFGALALFSAGFLICILRLTQLNEHVEVRSDAV